MAATTAAAAFGSSRPSSARSSRDIAQSIGVHCCGTGADHSARDDVADTQTGSGGEGSELTSSLAPGAHRLGSGSRKATRSGKYGLLASTPLDDDHAAVLHAPQPKFDVQVSEFAH